MTASETSSDIAAVIYCRISSKTQQHGISLQAQELACRNLCADRSYRVSNVVHEIASASEIGHGSKVTMLDTILEDMKRNEDPKVLVVYAVSRFSRSAIGGMHKALILKSVQKHLVSCTEMIDLYTSAGEFVFTQLLNAAQFESKLISDRVKSSLAYRKAQGWKLGRTPYGRKAVINKDGVRHFEDNLLEKDVAQLVRLLRTVGTSEKIASKAMHKISKDKSNIRFSHSERLFKPLDYSQIAQLLNDFGVKKRGVAWNSQSVRNIHS